MREFTKFKSMPLMFDWVRFRQTSQAGSVYQYIFSGMVIFKYFNFNFGQA